jgi:hypothetical protein
MKYAVGIGIGIDIRIPHYFRDRSVPFALSNKGEHENLYEDLI